MLSLALAFGAGMGWGTADFLGGVSSRRLPVLVVSFVSQSVGALFLLVVVLVGNRMPVGPEALVLGLGAGVVGGAGLLALYRGLAVGRMSVVAPTAALSGVVPVAWGLMRGERPSTLQIVGVVVAIVGVILAARAPGEDGGTERATGIGLALIAAVTLGAFVVMLDEAARTDPLWGALMVRVGALALLCIPLAVVRPSFAMRRGDPARVSAIGLLDNASNLSFAFAADTGGLLALTSVLGSLYPVATVLLARSVLHERLARHQTVGVVAALTGVVLIAAG
jgi:drug/metabolite transporter (DMT)-like permease